MAAGANTRPALAKTNGGAMSGVADRAGAGAAMSASRAVKACMVLDRASSPGCCEDVSLPLLPLCSRRDDPGSEDALLLADDRLPCSPRSV